MFANRKKFKILFIFFGLVTVSHIYAENIGILKKNAEYGYARDLHALAVAYRYGN